MERKILAAGIAALVIAGTGAIEAGALPANRNPAAVKAGAYALEPIHTRVLFAISHMGFTTWYGNFTGARGSLALDAAHPSETRLDVSLPVASLSTTNAKLDGELRGPQWFDAARFPTARFLSRKVTPTGPGRADVFGDLTLHGVTRPELLHVTFNGAGINPLDKHYTVGFNARGAIRRSDFGLDKYPALLGDEVELIISAAFERGAP